MRNLLGRSHEVLGVDQKIWLTLEQGGFGEAAVTGLIPLGAGAVEHMKADIKFNIPREDSAARSGRSVVTRLSGKKEVEISWESYIIPGTPDGLGNPTLPPVHPLLLSAFGTVDQTDPTKIVYKLSRFNANSFRMLEEATHYARLAVGCVAESMTFQLSGDGKAQISCGGFGQDVFVAGSSKVAVAGVVGDSTIKLPLGDGIMFEKGSYVDVVSQADGNTLKVTGKKIVSVTSDATNDILTFGAPLAAAFDEDDLVVGHAPATYSPLSSENALLGLKGSVSFAGYVGPAPEIVSAEVALTNNYTKKDFLYGTSKMQGYIPDKRRAVSVKVDMLLNKDNFAFFMKMKKLEAQDLTIKLEPQDIPAPEFASSVGRTFTFHMPRVEFNIPPIEQPADGYVTLSLEGVAMASSLNSLDDELTLTIE